MSVTVPPNTRNTWPLMCAAASEARYATSGATFSGANTSNAPSWSGAPMTPSPKVCVMSRVRARGAMQFAVIPYFFISRAVTWVSAAMPAFAAA